MKKKRWMQIIEVCKKNEKVSVPELVSLLGVSPATIRRDFVEMEELNMIQRFHGGVKLNLQMADEPGMFYKSGENKECKRRIAMIAAKEIRGNQLLYIDAGSTTLELISFIHAKNITVVTPSIANVVLLEKKEIPTIVVGGVIRWSTGAVAGKKAVDFLSDYHFDLCFVGTNGIHPTVGYTTSNEYEASTKRYAITHSDKAFILADSSKINKLNTYEFAKLHEATLICDSIKDFPADKLKYKLVM